MKREIFHYNIGELLPYIDWSYFVHTWGMKQSSPSTYDELIGDAKAMLSALDGRYRTHALFALCNARSEDDNIVAEGITIPLLRQQHSIAGKPNICLSDFVSPKDDRIGMFATCVDADFGAEYSDDTYMNLIAQTLADRLAEATATVMHRTVRTQSEYWGYAPDERLSIKELNREEYQGIRPAIGYPSLPDQSIIFVIDSILKLGDIGIGLTPNGAMYPHSSVCGLMFSHPASHYFSVGNISEEQFLDYCRRRGTQPENLRKFLIKNI